MTEGGKSINPRYRFARLFKVYGQVAMLGMLVVYAAFLFVILPTSDKPVYYGVVLFLIMAPLMGVGGYLFWRHSGWVVLTGDAIILKRWGRETKLSYQDVIAFAERDHHLPPNFVLKSVDRTLKFSRRLDGFPALYAALRHFVPVLQEAERPALPWRLSVGRRHYWEIVLAIGGFLALAVVLIGWGLVGGSPLGTAERVMLVLLTVLAAALLVAPMVVFVIRSNPLAQLRFYSDRFEARPLLWGEAQTWPVEALRQVRLMPKLSVVSTVPAQAYVDYALVLDLKGGEQLVIDEGRAWSWGCSLERLYFSLHHLYGQRGIGFKFLTQNSPVTV